LDGPFLGCAKSQTLPGTPATGPWYVLFYLVLRVTILSDIRVDAQHKNCMIPVTVFPDAIPGVRCSIRSISAQGLSEGVTDTS
jgi:hypothetical protein